MVLINKIKNKLRINYRKKRWPGLINAYKQYLPVTKKTPIVSLNEGNKVLALKPMNCPGHVQIFKQGVKSYKDLPIRMSEFG